MEAMRLMLAPPMSYSSRPVRNEPCVRSTLESSLLVAHLLRLEMESTRPPSLQRSQQAPDQPPGCIQLLP